LLRDVQRETGVSYLFITHDLNLLSHVADRVAVMYLGEIVEVRPAKQIGTPPYQPYTEALLSSAPVLDPAVKIRRIRLEGDLPSRMETLHGCVFENRCSRRIGDICSSEKPRDLEITPNHKIRCHHDLETLKAVPAIWKVSNIHSIDE
jgi:peptide/nickel transport system ATP-binding protein